MISQRASYRPPTIVISSRRLISSPLSSHPPHLRIVHRFACSPLLVLVFLVPSSDRPSCRLVVVSFCLSFRHRPAVVPSHPLPHPSAHLIRRSLPSYRLVRHFVLLVAHRFARRRSVSRLVVRSAHHPSARPHSPFSSTRWAGRFLFAIELGKQARERAGVRAMD